MSFIPDDFRSFKNKILCFHKLIHIQINSRQSDVKYLSWFMIHIKRRLSASTDSFHLSKFNDNPMWDFKKLPTFPNVSLYSYFKLVRFVPNLLRRPLVSVLGRHNRTGLVLSRKFQSRRGRGERGFLKRPGGGLQSVESPWVLSKVI